MADGGPEPLPSGLRQDWPVDWQPVWGDKEGPWRDVLSLAARGLLSGISRLPEPLLERSLGACARLSRTFLHRRSHVARAFLRQALDASGVELEERVLEAWRHFFRVVVDSERFPRRVPLELVSQHFDVRWSEDAIRVRDSGRGCVIVTAHVGNWETGSAALPWIGFDPFYGVAKAIRNRPFSKVVQRARERRGIRLLPRRGAMRGAPRVIEAGGAVGLLLDQRARVKPVLAPFFGRLARCDRSAGVLLRRLQAPVLISACYMTEKPLFYRIEFPDCIWPEEMKGAPPETIASRINRAFERMILAKPEQYLWLHDRYKHTPIQDP